MDFRELEKFYGGKRVLVTGHTGFKGSWLTRLLLNLGAEVCGYARRPPTDPSLFEAAGLGEAITDVDGDVRDLAHMQAVFAEARKSNCILFFDECDAIFGKRSEVKDAHDRNANVEVAYLLQQIEDHDGVCILATNLIQNIDAAFMRRITYVVHFPFPQAPERREIYQRTLPPGAPVDPDVDWEFLAQQFQLSGGHIKNIVLAAAFMAAAQDSPIQMRHLLTAAVNELRKNEMVVVREDLREYADLIDD